MLLVLRQVVVAQQPAEGATQASREGAERAPSRHRAGVERVQGGAGAVRAVRAVPRRTAPPPPHRSPPHASGRLPCPREPGRRAAWSPGRPAAPALWTRRIGAAGPTAPALELPHTPPALLAPPRHSSTSRSVWGHQRGAAPDRARTCAPRRWPRRQKRRGRAWRRAASRRRRVACRGPASAGPAPRRAEAPRAPTPPRAQSTRAPPRSVPRAAAGCVARRGSPLAARSGSRRSSRRPT